MQRAHGIAGQSLGQLARTLNVTLPQQLLNAKGWPGQLVEMALGATASSLPEPDFQHIGVELKTLPINAQGRPKESTHVCTVPLTHNDGLTWQTSWVRQKLARVLWVPIEADPAVPLGERCIGTPLLWSPSAGQEAILQQDWEELMDMVCLGQLEQITAHYGIYLQIRPKAADARALCPATGEDGDAILTLPRGFYLRAKFTAEILASHYILPEI